MPDSSSRRERKYHLVGWILFIVCAGFFRASSLESGSTLGLIASIIFLVACIAFLIPLIFRGK